MLVFFINLSLMEFQVRYLALFLLFAVIDGFKWFWMESLHMNIQLMLFLLYINDNVNNDVICDIAIYADDTTLYCKCDQASDLWQQLELASELESDLQDIGVRSGLLISMLGKLSWFHLTDLITMVLLT